MRKTDRRIERTRANIAAAMRELIMERDYDGITVTEIARRADVDRKTFYLHYPTKDALLASIEEQGAAHMLELLHAQTRPGKSLQVADVCRALDAALGQDLALHRRLASNPSYGFVATDEKHIVRQALMDALRPILDVGETVLGLVAEFYAAGLVATYVAWLRDGGDVSREALTTLAVSSVCSSIRSLPLPRRPDAPDISEDGCGPKPQT